jgi:predicted enzyme related to lactoylglutathione lyase
MWIDGRLISTRGEEQHMKGKIVHIEIPADDTPRAMKFWGDLAGWKFKNYADDAGEGAPEYNMFEGEPGGAVYPTREGEKGITVYFEVEDIDAELERINELGGSTEDKMPVPSMGWFAAAKDPEGNPFSVWQSDENAPGPVGMGAQSASSN